MCAAQRVFGKSRGCGSAEIGSSRATITLNMIKPAEVTLGRVYLMTGEVPTTVKVTRIAPGKIPMWPDNGDIRYVVVDGKHPGLRCVSTLENFAADVVEVG